MNLIYTQICELYARGPFRALGLLDVSSILIADIQRFLSHVTSLELMLFTLCILLQVCEDEQRKNGGNCPKITLPLRDLSWKEHDVAEPLRCGHVILNKYQQSHLWNERNFYAFGERVLMDHEKNRRPKSCKLPKINVLDLRSLH